MPNRTTADRASPNRASLGFRIEPQPDDVTCGPTCLHALYQYYGDDVPLSQVIAEVEPLSGGGTLAVSLACHALARGYDARIYTYNLNLFDPTWFEHPEVLPEKMRAQAKFKGGARLRAATRPFLRFFELGGQLYWRELRSDLIRHHLSRGEPILTGLSSTYLYECAREYQDDYDDVRGEPAGHFVVLTGYVKEARTVLVSDPLRDNPRFGGHTYAVTIPRLISAILLGIVTYDANLLVVTKKRARK